MDACVSCQDLQSFLDRSFVPPLSRFVVMDKLAIVQLPNELLGDISDQALCEEDDDILPFVLTISFYHRKELS